MKKKTALVQFVFRFTRDGAFISCYLLCLHCVLKIYHILLSLDVYNEMIFKKNSHHLSGTGMLPALSRLEINTLYTQKGNRGVRCMCNAN